MRAKNLRTITLILGVGALLCGPAARAEQGKFYLKADAGPALADDVDLNEFYGPVLSGSKIELKPGVRIGLRGGYGLTDWLDAEVETGIIANEVDSITGATEDDATLSQFPLLLNLKFHCPKWDKLSPYLGGGVGVSTVVLYGDDIVIGGTRMDGSSSGVAFAYQGFAGLRYAINDRMGLSLEYRYFGTSSSESDSDVTSGTISDELKLGTTGTHSITFAFDYKF